MVGREEKKDPLRLLRRHLPRRPGGGDKDDGLEAHPTREKKPGREDLVGDDVY
jgi:hypothetical protein